jgi:hypothetical protein
MTPLPTDAISPSAQEVPIADLVSVTGFLTTPNSIWWFVPHKFCRGAEKKAIAISRFGSVSDLAARELLRGLGLRTPENVQLCQIGDAPQRHLVVDDSIVREIKTGGFS